MRFKILACLVTLALALVAVQMTRYSYATGGENGMIVYRFDHLTGRVEWSMAASDFAWQKIGAAPASNWGDVADTLPAR